MQSGPTDSSIKSPTLNFGDFLLLNLVVIDKNHNFFACWPRQITLEEPPPPKFCFYTKSHPLLSFC